MAFLQFILGNLHCGIFNPFCQVFLKIRLFHFNLFSFLNSNLRCKVSYSFIICNLIRKRIDKYWMVKILKECYVKLKTFKASFYSSEKHFLFDNCGFWVCEIKVFLWNFGYCFWWQLRRNWHLPQKVTDLKSNFMYLIVWILPCSYVQILDIIKNIYPNSPVSAQSRTPKICNYQKESGSRMNRGWNMINSEIAGKCHVTNQLMEHIICNSNIHELLLKYEN